MEKYKTNLKYVDKFDIPEMPAGQQDKKLRDALQERKIAICNK